MKRHIYITIAFSAIAVGCTKSNIVDVPQGVDCPITFDIYNGKTPLTKASEVTLATLQSSSSNTQAFYVKAIKNDGSLYMDEPLWYATGDNPATAATETNYWDYDGTMYWPIDNTLTFMAYRPQLTFDASSSTVGTFTVAPNASAQQDLIVAIPKKNLTAASGNVSLEFKHVLSRIGFKLETVGTGVDVEISEISFNGLFSNQGTVTLTNDTPSIVPGNSTTASYSFLSSPYTTNGKTPVSTTSTGAIYDITATTTANDLYMMIIPETLKFLTDNSGYADKHNLNGGGNCIPYITVTYKLGSAAESSTVDLPLVRDYSKTDTPDWRVWTFEAGNAYEFIFKVSIEKIEFTGTVVDWEEDLDGNPSTDSDGDGDSKKDDDIYL